MPTPHPAPRTPPSPRPKARAWGRAARNIFSSPRTLGLGPVARLLHPVLVLLVPTDGRPRTAAEVLEDIGWLVTETGEPLAALHISRITGLPEAHTADLLADLARVGALVQAPNGVWGVADWAACIGESRDTPRQQALRERQRAAAT